MIRSLGRPTPSGPGKLIFGWLLVILLALGAIALVRRCRIASAGPRRPPVADQPVPPQPPPPLRFGFPTRQERLAETSSTAVYMPPASGKVESALYGSNRTALVGKRLVPRFHSGIDIAPLQRDRQGRPLDQVMAVADGRVAYLQSAAAGSSYGRYLLLHHQDPLGIFYSLYAHLDGFAPGLKVGDRVSCGQVIGRMGHSANTPIPVSRAHLHLEIGTMMHDRFGEWLHARGYPRTHGAAHGWNLNAIDPLRVLLERDGAGCRSLLDVLCAEPVAFTLLLETKRRPDYYQRYPGLWEAGERFPARVLIDVAAGGAPLRARPARSEDQAGAVPRIITADPAVLGRNGRGLISRHGNHWQLTPQGRQWLDQLQF